MNRNSRGNPSLCWLGGGGVRGAKIMNKHFVNNLAFPNLKALFHNENQRTLKGGGGKKEGGVQNLTRRPPTENTFQPPHLGTFFPPPYAISLGKSLRSAQSFPQLTTSLTETAFGGSRKMISDTESNFLKGKEVVLKVTLRHIYIYICCRVKMLSTLCPCF